jgi:hypothetical protein
VAAAAATIPYRCTLRADGRAASLGLCLQLRVFMEIPWFIEIGGNGDGGF